MSRSASTEQRPLAAPTSRPASPLAPDQYVLPEYVTDERTGRGPKFADLEWDFTPFVPRTVKDAMIRFDRLPDGPAQLAAREYFYSRINRAVPNRHRPRAGTRPMKITWVNQEFNRYVMIVEALAELGVTRLAEATQEHLDVVLRAWLTEMKKPRESRTVPVTDRRYRSHNKRARQEQPAEPIKPRTVGTRISTIKHMAAHRRFISGDALTFDPWPGRPALHVAQHPGDDEENDTPRIPEVIMAPLLKAAVFYVTTASVDITAALRELERLDAADEARPKLRAGEVEQRIRAFIDLRRRQGRGIPALPSRSRARAPEAPVVDGVIQAPNYTLVFQLSEVGQAWHCQPLILQAGAELGYEDGGLDTPISVWPDTGQPWRPRLSRPTLRNEIYMLRIACWIVIAYLSGMRDTEVRELRRDCAFTTEGHDGRTRYKLHGRVFKGRKLSGEEDEWVVLDVVHQAVKVLLEINDDPTHLFGYRSKLGHYTLLDTVPALLDDFRDHLNTLPLTSDEPLIPPDGEHDWRFTTRQFRRTLAWHLAHQPFGVVAGARQYKHAKIAMFEGYAGTSASGFAAEVAAEEAVAMLDYLEELYLDWDTGQGAAGGAAARINAEFDRIRRELGDLPGVVGNPTRLRTMLTHLAKTLHPGVLNDCFFQAATAVCVKRAKIIGRPVPQHNMCLRCPNARRSSVHLPRLVAARGQALEFQAACAHAGPVPQPQQIAITSYVAELAQLIDELQPSESPA
ncbi:hypothetical protein [Streptosporangium sp. NPDC001681]|uniref:hypothetical protein n=1 Tax=Streptosporangium sp. NPDC001681 TaxID=3154395 RepID=UPI00332EE6DB